ncbi:MAG: phosphatase [Alphaproteobacteria bacterium PA4]|nr:MAG: phosphatase [Alphaproteobacteria bacterium PA4]
MRRRLLLGAGVLLAGAAALGWALDRPPGYGATIAWAALLPGPPAAGSTVDRADRAAFAATGAGIDGPRWRQAATEIYPSSDAVTAEIACALGRRISADTTPATIRLVTRAATDMQGPAEAAKRAYRRNRPYVGAADTRTCDPRTLGGIGGSTGGVLSYAYPSGHAAFGRITALTLAAVLPDRAAALRAWGDRLGDNRLVCRVHWQSDVAAGRTLADALYPKLAALPAFRADVAAARAELLQAPAATGC